MSLQLYLNGQPLFLGVNQVAVPALPAADAARGLANPAWGPLWALEQAFLTSPWNMSAAPAELQAIHTRYRHDPVAARACLETLWTYAEDRGQLCDYILAVDALAEDASDLGFVERQFLRLFGRRPSVELRAWLVEKLANPACRRVDILWELLEFHKAYYADQGQRFHDLPRSLTYALAELHFCRGELAEAEACADRLSGVLQDLRHDDVRFRARWYRDHGLPPAHKVGQELENVFCDKAFGEYHVLTGGDVTHCCNEWLPLRIGSIFATRTAEELYNGPTTRQIRSAIQDGSYRFCAKEKCRFIRFRELPPKTAMVRNENYREIIETGSNEAPERFENIFLDYDPSCNLYCPSCRDQLINANPAERKLYDQATDERIMPLLAKTRRMSTSGYGDPFASPTFRRLLKNLDRDTFPGLTVNLMTNGLLLTPKRWEDYTHLNGRISSVSVSIDAAQADTYAVVRRGGKFDQVVENLAFIDQLRQEGHIAWFQINFVVQARNFREMPDFVRLGHRFHTSLVNFQQLYYWPTGHSETEFRQWAVHLPGHPEHAEFLQVLQDPLMSDAAVVHDFRHLVPARPWALTTREGLIDASGQPRDYLWTYVPQLGNIFTSAAQYPKFYQPSRQRWLEYQEGSQAPRIFSVVGSGELVEA